jgi:TetR/AcrR family transcriptional regulator, transcriptional repressor for nem operon
MSTKKGVQTREMILARAAPLFNQRGYESSSITDIMAATGLEKGGIYKHFRSKEELMLAAFDHAFAQTQQRMRMLLQEKRQAVERLYAIIDFFVQNVDEPPVAGGCPVMNTAIESDDAYPILRERAQAAMDQWFDTIHRIVVKGIERREIQEQVDAQIVADIFIASLEGALMVSKLYQDDMHMQRVATYLRLYVERELSIK